VTEARLVATVPAPLDPAVADAPEVLYRPGRRALVQRGDRELVVLDLDAAMAGEHCAEVRFPAPWTRRGGSATVSPAGDMAVFAGVHAVRAVAATGETRWEVRHACWGAACGLMHTSFAEYADDEEHRYPDGGSAAVSGDGRLVWAHVRGPLGDDDDGADDLEWWLVMDAADGSVLGRAGTGTVASASYPAPHPDPAQMGLGIAEGEEGSPVLWGRWDGQRLAVDPIGDELILLSVSPSGRRLLTVDLGQWSLSLHATEDGAVLRELDAQGTVPAHPEATGTDRVHWDREAAFVEEDTVVVGTSECDARHGAVRHWLVGVGGMTLRGEVCYPFPVSGPVRSAGDGTWYTVSADRTSLHLWRLAGRG
jgi:hypothetical protein